MGRRSTTARYQQNHGPRQLLLPGAVFFPTTQLNPHPIPRFPDEPSPKSDFSERLGNELGPDDGIASPRSNEEPPSRIASLSKGQGTGFKPLNCLTRFDGRSPSAPHEACGERFAPKPTAQGIAAGSARRVPCEPRARPDPVARRADHAGRMKPHGRIEMATPCGQRFDRSAVIQHPRDPDPTDRFPLDQLLSARTVSEGRMAHADRRE